MPQTILALGSILPPPEMEELEKLFDVVRLRRSMDPEPILQERKLDITGIVSTISTPVQASLIEALPNLEIISQFGVGVDNIDLTLAARRGVVVTNTPDVLTDDTADTAMALMLAVMRRVCEGDMYVRVGKWLNGPMPLGTSLSGKTVGIVGMGRIGRAIAKRCEAFGMNIVYHGPNKKDVPYEYHSDLLALANDADVMILACPGGPATEGIVNYPVMEALGRRGVLVNIARGPVIRQEDFLMALSNRVIAGAGLDVFWAEPNVPEPLISMDNVVLLPHVGSATTETRSAMARLVIDNLLAHFDGKPLKTPVAA